MTQYCRYCAYCFEADDYRCSNHPKGLEPHWSEADIKKVNKCKNFVLSELGDIITGRPYRPRKKIERGTLAKYLDPPSKFDSFQEDLFSMLMGNK